MYYWDVVKYCHLAFLSALFSKALKGAFSSTYGSSPCILGFIFFIVTIIYLFINSFYLQVSLSVSDVFLIVFIVFVYAFSFLICTL